MIDPYAPASDARFCCGRITHSGIHGDTLFLASIDAHLIAIDARTGRPLWNKIVADATAGLSMTSAPLVIKDKVIVGTAGGEFGIRGFIAAYDVQTGKEAWRFNTVPLPGEPGHETWGDGWKNGGGSIWVTGSYDPETNLTFWGVGNPGPDYNAKTRPGDNLYSCSVVAIDPDTGKLKWHYQFMPGDEFDWDAVQIPVLADITWQGKPRKTMLWANRNGFFYVLDRTTGEFLRAELHIAKQNWNAGFDNGRPIRTTNSIAELRRCAHLPGQFRTPPTGSVRPSARALGSFTSTSGKTPTTFLRVPINRTKKAPAAPRGGSPRTIRGGALRPACARSSGPTSRMEEENFGTVRALDVPTGTWKWEYKMSDLTDAGILTTASDVLVHRRSRRSLFRAGRQDRFASLEDPAGRADTEWPDDLLGERQAIRRGQRE